MTVLPAHREAAGYLAERLGVRVTATAAGVDVGAIDFDRAVFATAMVGFDLRVARRVIVDGATVYTLAVGYRFPDALVR